MKIYILTCINENAELVYCRPFCSLPEAQEEMEDRYEAERSEFLLSKSLDDDYGRLEPMYATVGNFNYHYNFQIVEEEL